MRIRIESDGTPAGTAIVNAETGEDLKLPLEKIEWELTKDNGPRAILTVGYVEIEATADISGIEYAFRS